MKLHHLRRNAGIAAAVLTLSVTLAACGDDGDDKGSSGNNDDTSAADGPEAQTFGEGCANVPAKGAGSFDGMVKNPVATAASDNPILTTLVAAVGAVDGLGDTLNGAEELTVFAPFNGAFEEIPPADLTALIEGGQAEGQDSTLYKILAHHVLGENADADAVAGDKDTLAGDQLTIEGDAESGMTVTDGTVTANVICGNIPTANATVYVIDKVLTGVK